MTLATDWLNLLFRWAHLVVGIGWIGTSFYFMALDYGLKKHGVLKEGVAGTSWLVHGGGFYHVEKYRTAPPQLPADLVWYRWEAYLTWVTGFLILAVQYYWNARLYLIDPSVMALEPWQAIAISIGSLVAGWFIYDGLCRSPLGRNPALLGGAVFALILVAAALFQQVFSGRGALIHVGAFVGTMMAVNVFGVIIPNQRRIVRSLIAGEAPDPTLGPLGKQRSTHNNYLTLPVLLMMVSNHYPMLTGHPQAWLLVGLIVIVGASVRHFINRQDAEDPLRSYAWTLPVAAVAFAAAVFVTLPRSEGADIAVSDAEAMAIVNRHCATCHAATPTHPGFEAPPKEVVLTTVEEVRRFGDAVLAQAVQTEAMPLGNETAMTGEERAALGAWLRTP